jgi:glycogen(starch) synthase
VKVAIASHGFLPSIGGVSTTESILAQAFVQAGHDVTVATLTPGPTDGYGHTVIRRPGPWALFQLYRSADIIILSNLAFRLFYPLLVMRRRFALRHHSESAFNLSTSWLSADRLRRAILPRATHFMTSAYIGRKSGFQAYFVTHPFAPYMETDIVLPAGERKDAVFVGRLEPEKGILHLLERWAGVRAALQVDRLRIIGNGTLAEEIQRRILTGAVQHVDYVGPLPRAETAREMGRASFSIIPSLWEEPFGAVALESLAAGTVVIHSDRGGLPETTGGLAFMFNPDDPASLDTALVAARRFHEALLHSPGAEAGYRESIARHVANYQPWIVVDRIISAMEAR